MKFHALALLVAAMMVVGCNEQSERGGPGVKTNGNATNGTMSHTTVTKDADGDKTVTTKTTKTTDSTDVIDKDKTFVVNKPLTDTNVEQGADNNMTVSIDRGSDFKQKVKLQFKGPKGVKVSPAEGMIQPDNDELKIVISADPDAPTGKQMIDVTAIPESGKSVTTQIGIDVKKKG